MDREKAIQVLKRCEVESHCEHYKRHYCCIGCGQREALDLAIEALQESTQDTQESTQDLISREAAVEAITEEMSEAWTESDADYNRGMEMAASIIEALPSAEMHEIRTETHSCVSETHGDLISRADAMAYPLSWEHYDKENGSRDFICGVESYREYIEALPSAVCDDCIWAVCNYNKVDWDATEDVDYCNNCPYISWDSDLISRQAAIEAVEVQYFGGTVADINPSWRKLHNILESIPPVTPTERTGEWVPVSEMLPREKQEVYVTVYFTEGDTGRAYGYIDGFGNWHLYSTAEGTLNSGYEVTAWMPLPEPYKAESEEV